tara:strand:- start:2173 stop:2436 length:264 start_codon:yes stop_codon:yes gene_type:complete
MYKIGSDVFTSKKNARKHHWALLKYAKNEEYYPDSSFYKIWFPLFRMQNPEIIPIKFIVERLKKNKYTNVYYVIEEDILIWKWFNFT